MAVNYFTFGGVSSSTYDVYISGEGVWSAPVRDAEMVTIPGRNGAFVHDLGRFENIEVTYPAFIVKDNNTNFKAKVDAFRNALASQVGYKRLTDTFHTDEYRMAAFVDGLEVNPILYNDHSAKFDIKFNCKPQRYLTSGETAVTVANNGTVTNPTLFGASPLIAAKGYGDIGFNGHIISLNNATMGNVILGEYAPGIRFNSGLLNIGDTISVTADFSAEALPTSYNVTSVLQNTIDTNPSSGTPSISRIPGNLTVVLAINNITDTFTAGTTASHTFTAVFKVKYVYSGVQRTSTITFNATLGYSATESTIRATADITANNDYNATVLKRVIDKATANSSKSVLGNPTYIDCDLGEAYKIENDEYISLDRYIDLGTDLPTLASGINTISYNNTFTEVKITPRWWKV